MLLLTGWTLQWIQATKVSIDVSSHCSVINFIRLQVYADRRSNLGKNAEKLHFLAYNIRLFQKIDVSVSPYD